MKVGKLRGLSRALMGKIDDTITKNPDAIKFRLVYPLIAPT